MKVDAGLLREVGQGNQDEGWLPVERMPATVHALLRGERKVVRVLGAHRRGRITARARYSPYRATVEWEAGRTDGDEGRTWLTDPVSYVILGATLAFAA